jgi:hypothetical protein
VGVAFALRGEVICSSATARLRFSARRPLAFCARVSDLAAMG